MLLPPSKVDKPLGGGGDRVGAQFAKTLRFQELFKIEH